MKKLFLITAITFFVLQVNAQSSEKHEYVYDGVAGHPVIDPTSITVASDGIPVYFWVLKYNGKTIALCPANYAFYVAMYKPGEVAEFVVPKSTFTSDQALELISDYGCKLDDNIVHIRVSKYKDNTGKLTEKKLPDYLKYSVEKLSFK